MRKTVATIAVMVMLAVGFSCSSTPNAQAWSHSSGYKYSNGNTLQANIWLGTGQYWYWQSSAKYLGNAYPAYADSITNSVHLSVTGVGVNLGKVSGSSSSGKEYTASWTNSGSVWISDLAGSNSTSNKLYLYITGQSGASASIPYFGTPRSASAATTKLW